MDVSSYLIREVFIGFGVLPSLFNLYLIGVRVELKVSVSGWSFLEINMPFGLSRLRDYLHIILLRFHVSRCLPPQPLLLLAHCELLHALSDTSRRTLSTDRTRSNHCLTGCHFLHFTSTWPLRTFSGFLCLNPIAI
jgi:hypothetical protein